MTIRHRLLELAAVATLAASACGSEATEPDPLVSDTVGAATTSEAPGTTTTAQPTTTEPPTTTQPQRPVAFEATPSEVEARVEFFGEVVGNSVGTFAPIQNSQIVGAKVDGHAVGYLADPEGRVMATALYIALDPGQTQFSTPARLLSIVATAPIGSGEIEAATEVFSREVLPDLSTIGAGVQTFAGGPPFFELTSVVRSDSVLFVAKPPESSERVNDEFDQRLSTIVD